jgi:2-hydroxycyclohexanecarboxyl-CoA dehydrogenase
MERFAGKNVIVTGAGRGIGRATAVRFASEGADVMCIGRTLEPLEETASLCATGWAHRADVASTGDVDEAVATAMERWGRFDVLVNNAGIDEFGFFTKTTPDQWERVLAVNLVGVLACTHAALPGMQAAGYGRIVSTSSEAGRVGSKGSAVYSAAKGGVIAFMKVMARENARFGITANSIAPGPIETPLLMGATALGELGERIIETMKSATQLRRLGKPEEVAAAIAFLASEEAGYITGETLGVSGGLGMV